jgi:hypothetical protein
MSASMSTHVQSVHLWDEAIVVEETIVIGATPNSRNTHFKITYRFKPAQKWSNHHNFHRWQHRSRLIFLSFLPESMKLIYLQLGAWHSHIYCPTGLQLSRSFAWATCCPSLPHRDFLVWLWAAKYKWEVTIVIYQCYERCFFLNPKFNLGIKLIYYISVTVGSLGTHLNGVLPPNAFINPIVLKHAKLIHYHPWGVTLHWKPNSRV